MIFKNCLMDDDVWWRIIKVLEGANQFYLRNHWEIFFRRSNALIVIVTDFFFYCILAEFILRGLKEFLHCFQVCRESCAWSLHLVRFTVAVSWSKIYERMGHYIQERVSIFYVLLATLFKNWGRIGGFTMAFHWHLIQFFVTKMEEGFGSHTPLAQLMKS